MEGSVWLCIRSLLSFNNLFIYFPPSGLGLAFNLNPALTMIGKYFYIRRPIANGIAMAGSPVFLSTLAPINTVLFDKFGWRGSFMILGGLLLNCCVAGSLMRPIGPKPKPAVKTTERRTVVQTINNFIDLSLFKHRGFLLYVLGNIIMFFGLFTPLVFLSNYAKSKDIPKEKAAFLLSVLAFVDMFARPSMGIVANTKWIRPRVQYFFAASVLYNGICHILAPLSVDYKGFVIYAIFFGFAFGWLSSVLFETLMDLVGTQRFSSAVGLVTIVECGPVLLGPPLLGEHIGTFSIILNLIMISVVYTQIYNVASFCLHREVQGHLPWLQVHIPVLRNPSHRLQHLPVCRDGNQLSPAGQREKGRRKKGRGGGGRTQVQQG